VPGARGVATRKPNNSIVAIILFSMIFNFGLSDQM